MMWGIFDGVDSDWDTTVIGLYPRSPFHTSSWAHFRAVDGWEPLRLIATDKSCAIQFLVRKVRGSVVIGWAPGGPLGPLTPPLCGELLRCIRGRFPRQFIYLRVSDFQPKTSPHSDLYLGARWVKSQSTLAASSSLLRPLTADEAGLRSGYSSNWSRNLHRGKQRSVTSVEWQNPSFTEMANIHQEVVDLKQSFQGDWQANPDRLERLFQCFGDSIELVRAIDDQQRTLAYRAAVRVGTLGYDILAATSREGRKCYASHVATHGLLTLLATSGCTEYDFGGVDPITNRGVYNFKHGAGGRDFHYTGEFQTSWPTFIAQPIARVIRRSSSHRQNPLDKP